MVLIENWVSTMIRASKTTDYGLALLAAMAGTDGEQYHSVRELAASTGVPRPTAAKVLKELKGHDWMHSQRGPGGGYRLGREPREISLAEVVNALEGPVALADCLNRPGSCGRDQICQVRGTWAHLNEVLVEALTSMSLADLVEGPRGRSPSQRGLRTSAKKEHVDVGNR